MKKLISLILAIVMICACALSVSAFSPVDPESEEGKLKEAMISELEASLTDYILKQTGEEIEVYIGNYFSLEEDEYKIVSFQTDADVEKEYFSRMGIFAYRCYTESPVFKEGFAVYTVADNQWRPLSYMYEKDITALYDLCTYDFWRATNIKNEFNYITHFAIVGTPNITVVSVMQKYLAGMDVSADVTAEEVQYLDVDNDGVVTIKDASELQRFIAGLPPIYQ